MDIFIAILSIMFMGGAYILVVIDKHNHRIEIYDRDNAIKNKDRLLERRLEEHMSTLRLLQTYQEESQALRKSVYELRESQCKCRKPNQDHGFIHTEEPKQDKSNDYGYI